MSDTSVKTINLALQGGGSHGAFTWGVLDRLLQEEGRLRIEGISGTSAGALNAVLLMQGYAEDGAAGARRRLDEFWHRVGGLSIFGFAQRTVVDQMLGNWNIDKSPGTMMMDMMGRLFSPYQLNPFNLNPLRDILVSMVDIEKVQKCTSFKLFVAASNVETGRVRLFTGSEVTVDVLMASACVPFSFQAVQIDGVPYWDGGYTANPAIFPLIYQCESQDIAIVQLIPFERKGTPSTLTEIINRLDEISFNSSLFSEMRAITLVQRLIDEGKLRPEKTNYKRMNIHVIRDEAEIAALGATSKISTENDFLLHLKQLGQQTADRWLHQNWDSIGKESSFDIDKNIFSHNGPETHKYKVHKGE